MAKNRNKRPDTPLASTPEPVYDRLQGSTQTAMELKKNREAEDAAYKSIRDKKNNDALNQIAKDSQAYDNARYK
jgi:hypothetical protein